MDAVATEKAEDRKPGKKRARQEAGEDRPSPTKKAKASTKLLKKETVGVLKKTKPSTPSKAKVNAVDPKLFLTPKWKVKDMKLPKSTILKPQKLTELKPRIWASNREELFAVLPEMTGSKCINGVSWKLFDTPMILLDDKNEIFQVVRDSADILSLEVSMTQSFIYSVSGKTRPDDSPPSTYPPQHINQHICKPEPNLDSLQKPIIDTFKTKRVAHRYPAAPSKDSANKFDNVQNTGLITFPTPTIPNHGPIINGHGLAKFGRPSSNGIHPMLLESTKEVQQYQPPRRPLPVDFSSNAVSTQTSTQTSRAVDIQNDFSSLLSKCKIPSMATQPSQIDRNQPIPLHPYNSRFQDEQYVSTILNLAEREFSGPASRTTAAHSFTTSSQVPTMPKDKPISLPQSELVDTGEPPVRPHPKAQLKDLFRMERFMAGATRNDVAVQGGVSNFASIPDLNLNPPGERQYASSNPMPLYVPCTVPAGPPSVQVDTNWVKSHNVMNIVHSPEQSSTPLPEFLKQPPREPEPPVNRWQDPWGDYVPSPIPEEVQALINAYVSGRPFNLFVARSRLYDYWNLALPEEFGFVMMGFFRVLFVQESRLRDDPMLSQDVNPTGLIKGNVEWKFRLQWTPGGEESLTCHHNFYSLGHPWWAPISQRPTKDARYPLIQQVTLDPNFKRESEDKYPTTPRYRIARTCHPDYKFRDRPIGELYSSLLPLSLLAPFGPSVMDTTFPRGWYCTWCGKLNFQAALRQRKCSSLRCKDMAPVVPPYVVELSFMRDPQDRLQLSLPINTYPQPVKMKVAQFLEGTRVLTYMIRGEENTYIQHVFTGNLLRLQPHATLLMRDIQLYVELTRPCTENGPYFYYIAAAPSDLRKPTDKKWSNLPGCLNQAKEIVLHRTRMYGEVKDTQISVNHLRLLAWVTAGTKKSPDPIRAKKHCVMFLAFGCNVVLTVWPRSMEVKTGNVAAIVAAKVEEQEVELYTIADSNNAEVDGGGGWIAHGANIKGEDDTTTMTVASQSLASPKKGKAPEKPPRPSFVITLVHGDHVVFFGDDFEYSVKREGTSFLLMLSHQDS